MRVLHTLIIVFNPYVTVMAVLTIKDQCGNLVELDAPPKRIVSLVPSQTELLWELDLVMEVAGITKYCVHPTHWISEKKLVGGTKNFDFSTIATIQPDLIIANKEENYQEGIERLQQQYPVWLSDIVCLEDALQMIESIGLITHRSYKSAPLVNDITQAFQSLKKISACSALYLIWRKPWMAAAHGTFIHDMLQRIGFVNALEGHVRYPELTNEEISQMKPDYILLSSEPFPFSEKHVTELRAISPSSEIILVDGEMFSWYGSRLKLAPGYFNSLPLQRI